MATFINLTPHDVNVILADGSIVTFERSGTIARCNMITQFVKDVDGISLSNVAYGPVVDLPTEDRYAEKYYIVSMLVRQTLPMRNDLVSPGELVRNEYGVIIGCKGFTCN